MIIDRLFDRSARGLLLVLPVLAVLLTSLQAFAQFPSGAMPGSASPKQAAGQQQTAQPEDPTRHISDLLATLEDPALRERLTAQLRTLLQTQEQTKPEAVEPPSSRVLEFMSERVGRLSRQMVAFGSIFADLPDTVEWLQRQATDEMRRDRWIQVLLQLVLTVGAGFVASALASRLLRRVRLSIENRRNERILARIPLVILRTILELVPIGAFAIAGYGTLSFTDPPLVVRLVALIVINATILIQLILALTRGVLAPMARNLRMLPIGDESAHYGYIWVRRLAYTAVYGFFISEAAYMLGLPTGAYEALLKVVGLVVIGMLVILILQNRKDVAEWLRGRPLTGGSNGHVEAEEIASGTRNGAFRAARRRLADV
jgi:small conductance mechanosensitive channel